MNDSTQRTPDRAVRVEDVARVAGVSPITVSRALRTPEKVKPATLERVLQAVRETGYQVNAIASSLRSGQSAFVTVFVASLQNVHYAEAMQGMLDAFESSRFHLMFAQIGYAEDLSASQVRAMLPFKPAAVVFSGIVRDAGARLFLRSLNVPVLEMWGETDEVIDMLVASPGREGGRLMGEHFGEQGYERIAYVGHTSTRASHRIAGFEAGLSRHGKKVSLLVPAEGAQEMKNGVEVLEQVLARMPDCDAILFGTDVLAAGALVRAQELGISMPDQIAIAGYGDLFFAAHTRPKLTSVHTAPHQVGRIAGKLLRQRLETGKVDKPIIQVPLHLEVRGSTLRR